MKHFIEIKGANDVIYKINANHITHFYITDKSITPMEIRLDVKWTRVTTSCGTEFATKTTIQEIEKLIEKALN